MVTKQRRLRSEHQDYDEEIVVDDDGFWRYGLKVMKDDPAEKLVSSSENRCRERSISQASVSDLLDFISLDQDSRTAEHREKDMLRQPVIQYVLYLTYEVLSVSDKLQQGQNDDRQSDESSTGDDMDTSLPTAETEKLKTKSEMMIDKMTDPQ
ncbi:OLC1v1005884C1 [Oldenlandia corymbosa var. corymbosa]|uniref:OLC1v1005884C1 n=1 Tax=Oldenlandia corymbosa var. corymbosa TaxID=529605 RepID=A0AAV1DI12_OLDCO|nr:OLC1v1005884C1 [Oldenlandia corymbosa var. corymbosa]